jgi:N-acyl-D-aspartate/D-glutamate deacylase
MSAAAITFDQMERTADKTLALAGVAAWAKHARVRIFCSFVLQMVHKSLAHLVEALTPEHLEVLTDEQALDLTKKLQHVHCYLTELLERAESKNLSRSFLFRDTLIGIDELTEDLGDIIEDLVLSNDQEFRSLLGECVDGLAAARTAETFARV